HSTRPDIQFHFGTISADMAAGKPHDFSGFTISMCQLRPKSRGFVSIRSKNPFDAPLIQLNFFAEKEDKETMLAGIKLTRKLVNSSAMMPYIDEEYRPGPSMQSEEDMINFVRRSEERRVGKECRCRLWL